MRFVSGIAEKFGRAAARRGPRFGLILGLAAGLLAAVACGGAPSFDEPPKIVYGVDVCSACNMIINEENFAAAYWTVDGEARMFDDLGEMLIFIHDHPDEKIASVWVHDMNTAQWLRAGDAWIVMNAGLSTPMGTGVAAVANEQDAQALAHGQSNALVLTFDDLMKQMAEGHLMIPMGGGHGGMGSPSGMDDHDAMDEMDSHDSMGED